MIQSFCPTGLYSIVDHPSPGRPEIDDALRGVRLPALIRVRVVIPLSFVQGLLSLLFPPGPLLHLLSRQITMQVPQKSGSFRRAETPTGPLTSIAVYTGSLFLNGKTESGHN